MPISCSRSMGVKSSTSSTSWPASSPWAWCSLRVRKVCRSMRGWGEGVGVLGWEQLPQRTWRCARTRTCGRATNAAASRWGCSWLRLLGATAVIDGRL